MDAGLGVVGSDVGQQWLRASVDGDACWVCGGGEAVVEAGASGTKSELLGGVEVGPRSWSSCWDALGIDGEVVGGWECHNRAIDSLISREVEVRVIGHVDGSFISTANQVCLIFDAQYDDFLSVNLLSTGRVSGCNVNSARKAFIAIFTMEGELDTFATSQAIDSRNLTNSHRLRSIPHLLAPTCLAAVERVALQVGRERPSLAVQVVDFGAMDAIGNSSDCSPEEGAVVLGVQLFGGEAIDDVEALDLEGLDDGAERDQLNRSV